MAPKVLAATLIGLLMWRIVFQANYAVGVNLLEECWNRNLTNVLASPLTKAEWLVASLVLSLVKVVILMTVVGITISWIYGISVFTIGWWWFPFLGSLILSGWAFGFMACSLVIWLGIRAQAFAWTFAWVLMPISAVYYPAAWLPGGVRWVSDILPTTYIFEGMRLVLLHEQSAASAVAYSYGINLLYVAFGLWLLDLSFEKARDRGFDHLE
jgi:ABC-2 type transport system permease protein